MTCRALWNTNINESFHSDALSEIDFMYSTKESENKDSECIFCNGKCSEDEQGEIWIYRSRVMSMQCISMTFINRLEAEIVFAYLKNMIFIVKNNYVL